MSDSSDREQDENSSDVNFTNLLFGNINDNGELIESDVFDSESQNQLSSLSKLGFGLSTIVKDLLKNIDRPKQDEKKDNDDEATENSQLDSETRQELDSSKNGVANTVDFFDIDELAEDVNSLEFDKTDYDAIEEKYQKKANEMKLLDESNSQKKLDTPLAAMLPSKYANVDVRELFPDFRPNQVLRFSRLFAPGRTGNLPQPWKNIRKKKKKKDQMSIKMEKDDTVNADAYYESVTNENSYIDENTLIIKDVKKELSKTIEQTKPHDDLGTKFSDWRFGPAQLWYDLLGVSENPDEFDYGFKLKKKRIDTETKIKEEDGIENADYENDPFPEDAYLMVSQLHWEDNIVWDGDHIKNQVLSKMNSKTNAAGWVPSSTNRTAQAFSQPGKTGVPMVTGGNAMKSTAVPITTLSSMSQQNKNRPNQKSGQNASQGQGTVSLQQKGYEAEDDTWYSIFPVENAELVYGDWENEIIWDPEEMPEIPKPKILTLDPNDENIILGIPDDVDPSKQIASSAMPVKVKIPHPHVKKSKLLLGKAGVINLLQEDTPPPPPKSPNRDPFNISNDVYYMPRSEVSIRLKVGGTNLIQHSTPVVELRAPFVPTHMGVIRLRNFHRSAIKRYSHGPLTTLGPHPVQPLGKNIRKKQQQREQERKASGGGDVFFMRTPEDLSGKDGDLILIEFSEEHPPLMNQIGMCSKIKNYYKRIIGKDSGPKSLKYGETAYVHTSPFLGILQPGQTFQAVENNMYRAPIYQQQALNTDFLLIRTRQGYFIREYSTIFVSGQECPLYEVPGPNSKRANNFVRDFLQVFIYRLFWKSPDTPRRIRMDDIKKAFPSHSESSIRKRLKLCADFKRTGADSNWWVVKPDFRLPSEEEIRAMVSPEQCCAYFSMIAAEQRLKDAGYGEKSLFAAAEDDDEETQLKMDDEVKVAPWNTTRAFIQAMKGKCLLQLTGPADPTGCGEGFSYVRVPNKPTQNKEEQESQPKRTVTGTDADLRRLSLNNAKALLKQYGVPDEEIKKLSRWEVIDVVRTLSTEKAKAGEEGMTKFSRGNRFSIAEHQERYKEECQRIFDLQNRVLCSSEILSTDEGESTDEDDAFDIEEMGKNLENMLSNKKTSTQLSLEREEQERQELRRMLLEGNDDRKNKEKKKDDEESQDPFSFSAQGRVLKIHRTFKNPEGKEYTRVEIVRKPAVIDAYVRIRTTKDENFIRHFISLDEQQKEEMKREKRRIQEQLRRLKRTQEKERQLNNLSNFASKYTDEDYVPPQMPNKKIRKSSKADTKVRCMNCGGLGHMRKTCKQNKNGAAVNSSATGVGSSTGGDYDKQRDKLAEQQAELEKEPPIVDEDLVNVEGTKMKLSSKLLKHAEEYKKQLMKNEAALRKRKRVTNENCDYLKKHLRPANRRRTDPVVVLSTIFEKILNEIRDLPGSQPFCFPVNGKVVVDYYKIIQKPMDLQTIRENLRQKRYTSREEFLADVHQILENSTMYNGPNHTFTGAAKQMLDKTIEKVSEKEEILMKLEKTINPLLDDNDQVALSFILENILTTKLNNMQEAWPFQKPVNKRTFKDYYTLIKVPMDLETVKKKVSAHKYHNRKEFESDITLILTNCELYNGKESAFTQKAKALLQMCKDSLQEYDEHLSQLEQKISITQEKAMEEAENDNSWLNEDDLSMALSDTELAPEKRLRFDTSASKTGATVSRGRGRPKKTAKISLEDDLQFSSDDEDHDGDAEGDDYDREGDGDDDDEADNEFDDVPSDGEEGHQDGIVIPIGNVCEESKQAAEAMMLLKNMNFTRAAAAGETETATTTESETKKTPSESQPSTSLAPPIDIVIKQEEIDLSERVAVSGYPMVEYSHENAHVSNSEDEDDEEDRSGRDNQSTAQQLSHLPPQIQDDLAMSESDNEGEADADREEREDVEPGTNAAEEGSSSSSSSSSSDTNEDEPKIRTIKKEIEEDKQLCLQQDNAVMDEDDAGDDLWF